MAGDRRILAKANDSVCKLTESNGDLAKTLNSLRTVPGAANPFVAASRNSSSSAGPSRPATVSSGVGVQSGKK